MPRNCHAASQFRAGDRSGGTCSTVALLWLAMQVRRTNSAATSAPRLIERWRVGHAFDEQLVAIQLDDPDGEVLLMSPSQALALGQALVAEGETLSNQMKTPTPRGAGDSINSSHQRVGLNASDRPTPPRGPGQRRTDGGRATEG